MDKESEQMGALAEAFLLVILDDEEDLIARRDTLEARDLITVCGFPSFSAFGLLLLQLGESGAHDVLGEGLISLWIRLVVRAVQDLDGRRLGIGADPRVGHFRVEGVCQ